MFDREHFNAIRKAYASRIPKWMNDYAETGEMRIDPYFFEWRMTPIEDYVWIDIRSMLHGFSPQFPTLNYFLDFANPFLKIGIECDGKQWHDAERDKARDKRLEADGWVIYRITGRECVKTVEPCCEDPDVREEHMRNFYLNTSMVVINAINRFYFHKPTDYEYEWWPIVCETIDAHRTTRETYPEAREVKKSDGVKSFADAMDEHQRVIDRRKHIIPSLSLDIDSYIRKRGIAGAL